MFPDSCLMPAAGGSKPRVLCPEETVLEVRGGFIHPSMVAEKSKEMISLTCGKQVK